jgi:hypothetical protein
MVKTRKSKTRKNATRKQRLDKTPKSARQGKDNPSDFEAKDAKYMEEEMEFFHNTELEVWCHVFAEATLLDIVAECEESDVRDKLITLSELAYKTCDDYLYEMRNKSFHEGWRFWPETLEAGCEAGCKAVLQEWVDCGYLKFHRNHPAYSFNWESISV